MKTNLLLDTIQDLENIEKVSPRVSKSYVPIYSSDIANILQPEYQYSHGVQFVKGSTKHYIELKSDTETLRIYNSYDRSLALRLTLHDGISVDLGVNRLIHRGEKAKVFIDNLKEVKEDILAAVQNTKKIIKFFETTKITDDLKKEISDIIFKYDKQRKGFQEYTNYVDLLDINIKNYISQSIDKYMDGDYTLIINGSKRNGTKTKSTLRKVKLENEIIKHIEKTRPEYFL